MKAFNFQSFFIAYLVLKVSFINYHDPMFINFLARAEACSASHSRCYLAFSMMKNLNPITNISPSCHYSLRPLSSRVKGEK